MTELKFKYVVAFISLLGTIVFNSMSIVFLQNPLNKNSIICKDISEAVLQETFYNDIIKEILPIVIAFHVCGVFIGTMVAISSCIFGMQKYKYFLLSASFLAFPLFLSVPLMVIITNHALYHAITQLEYTYNCVVNFFFIHKVILPMAVLGILFAIFTIGYYSFYLVIYETRFDNDAFFSPTILLNAGAIEAELDEIALDIEKEKDSTEVSSEF